MRSPTVEVEGKRPFSSMPSHLATKTSRTCSMNTPAGLLNGTYRLSSVRPSQRSGIIRMQRPTTSARASPLASSATSARAKARQTLEAILGPATVIVASGGQWTNPETGEIEPKLHLHWRLNKPTTTTGRACHAREARKLATELVGGDGTNISIVHPIRWPGSWHRKGTPRLAKIVASSDNEIDLAEAVERLRDASGAATFAGFGFKTDSKFRASDPAAVASALSVIPNDNLSWADWNRIGMATWAATGGSEVGREAFAEWSAKASKNDPDATESRWQHYKTSPPTRIGFGTLVYLARKHSPGWSYGSAEAKFGETSAKAEEQAKADPGALQLDDFYAYMPDHSYIFVPTREMWPASSVNSRLPASAGAEEGRHAGRGQEWKAETRQSQRLARQTSTCRADDVGARRAADNRRQVDLLKVDGSNDTASRRSTCTDRRRCSTGDAAKQRRWIESGA